MVYAYLHISSMSFTIFFFFHFRCLITVLSCYRCIICSIIVRPFSVVHSFYFVFFISHMRCAAAVVNFCINFCKRYTCWRSFFLSLSLSLTLSICFSRFVLFFSFFNFSYFSPLYFLFFIHLFLLLHSNKGIYNKKKKIFFHTKEECCYEMSCISKCNDISKRVLASSNIFLFGVHSPARFKFFGKVCFVLSPLSFLFSLPRCIRCLLNVCLCVAVFASMVKRKKGNNAITLFLCTDDTRIYNINLTHVK